MFAAQPELGHHESDFRTPIHSMWLSCSRNSRNERSRCVTDAIAFPSVFRYLSMGLQLPQCDGGLRLLLLARLPSCGSVGVLGRVPGRQFDRFDVVLYCNPDDAKRGDRLEYKLQSDKHRL
jgi:hypothetical protein